MEVMNRFIETYDIHDSIDLENTIITIQGIISDDPSLLDVFNYRYLREYSRAETISELNITPGEYNNRIRRLDTVFKRVLKSQS